MERLAKQVEMGLLVLISLLFPFQFHVTLGTVTVNASYADPLVGVVLFLFVFDAFSVSRFDRLYVALIAFVLLAGVGVAIRFLTQPTYFVFADSAAEIIKQSFSFSWMVAIYILVSRDPYRRIWVFALTTAVVAGGLGAVSTAMNVFSGVKGMSGPFTNRNLYANYLTLSLFLSLSWLYWLRKNRMTRPVVTVIFTLSAGFAFYALLSTASRAPTAGLVLGLAVVADWQSVGRRLVRNIRLLFGVVLGAGGLVGIVVNQLYIFDRFVAALHGSAIGHRLQTWPASLEGFLAYPLFGIGLGQHPNYLARSVTPHNTPILIVSATGALGLIVALWFVLGLLRRAFVLRFVRENHYLGLFVGFFVSSLAVGMFHDINNFRSFWIAAGLLTATVARPTGMSLPQTNESPQSRRGETSQ